MDWFSIPKRPIIPAVRKDLEIDLPTGFADAAIEGYRRTDDSLEVFVRLWNDTVITLNFKDLLALSDLGVGDISGFSEETEATPFFVTAVLRHFENPPTVNQYRQFRAYDLDGNPVLEIVASTVHVQGEQAR